MPASPAKPQKRTYKEQKEFESLEEEILQLEERQTELEKVMADPDYEKARRAGEEYTASQNRLEEAYNRWSELAELSPN